jgi:hypothetical protein
VADADLLIRFRGRRHIAGYMIRDDLLVPVPARDASAGGRWSQDTLDSMRGTLASMESNKQITQKQRQEAEGILGPSAIEDYDPPDDAYREFAELGDDEQIIAFARRRGLLGIEKKRALLRLFTRKDKEKDIEQTDEILMEGEPLDAWRREIAAVQEMLEYWRAPQSSDPGASFLQIRAVELVNERLNQPLRLARDGDRYRLELAPKTLLAFIWTQLAQALAGGISVRRCLCGCGRWMVVQPSGNASRRLTSTLACRIRAHHRRVEARRLRKRRMGIEKIAERMGIDAAIIEELLAVKSKGGKK